MTAPAPVLLLSDLHLPTTASPLRDAFVDFLAGPARAARAVYLLGDIFEYWIGDDIGLPAYRRECEGLRALTRAGVRSYLVHGNRDYLLGTAFSQFTGVELLPDPYYTRLGGIEVLLSHGDIWCTQDHAYQRFRRISRSGWGRAFFLSWPRPWRVALARRLRRKAEQRPPRAEHDPGVLDVVEDAIRDTLTQSKVSRIVHGHTHRPGVHAYPDLAAQRWVLADWRAERMEYLEVSEELWQRRLLAAAASHAEAA